MYFFHLKWFVYTNAMKATTKKIKNRGLNFDNLAGWKCFSEYIFHLFFFVLGYDIIIL